jgi:nitroreductase
MELREAIRGRRSVREYADTPVDRELVQFVIEAATQAPSARNRQAWSFVVTTDRARLARWSERAKSLMLESMAGNPALEGYREHLASPSFNIFYNAPVLIVISTHVADPMATHDCCLAAQNLMLAAYSRGLGSCWIGFSESWLALPEAKRELGLPDEQVAVAPIILGYPRQAPRTVPREPARIRWLS